MSSFPTAGLGSGKTHQILIFQPVGKRREVECCSRHRRRLQSGVSLLTSHLLLQTVVAHLSPLRRIQDEPVLAFDFKIWLEWRLELLTPSVAASLLAFPSFNLIGCTGPSAETRQSDRNPIRVTGTFSKLQYSFSPQETKALEACVPHILLFKVVNVARIFFGIFFWLTGF